MDNRLYEIEHNKENNYLLPFYWQMGNHTDKIPAQMKEIYDSGARAVCVESRTHNDFCGEGWWRDLKIILDEAKKRNMKVWILDDSHFPTGYANGLIKKKYPNLKKTFLIERHMDVVGPEKNSSILATPYEKDDVLIGAYMYKRDENVIETFDNIIDLTGSIKDDFLYFDVPKGVYRIYLYWQSHITADDYIDMINTKSTDVLLEAIYEPHYKHLKKYFGNTLVGFFSDEPGIGNNYYKWGVADVGFYDKTIGCPGLAMPYNSEVCKLMQAELGFDPKPYLADLWFDFSNKNSQIRLAYMNAITQLYKKNFSEKLGNWCRNHNVEYIGHIIEDQNAHTKLGCSIGHYFRAMRGQDMAGVDIVYQQVMPGFAHMDNGFFGACEETDSEFYHYSLAKMCSSAAHIDPKKKNRALCEVLGAGGWAEGSRLCKWLIDFLLVRGINHFVPHAFSPNFPNEDCPPHFGCEGHDPQFDAFSELMKYTNKASHLLSDGVHIANCAILYNAEGEWTSKNDYMNMQKCARVLMDNHIDFDFLPLDTIMDSDIKNKKLAVNQEVYDCLFIPFTHYFDEKFLNKLNNLSKNGFKIVFLNGLPDNCRYNFTVIDYNDSAEWFNEHFSADITVDGEFPLLRHYHIKRDDVDVFMFFNESVFKNVNTTVNVGINSKFTRLDMLNNLKTVEDSNGKININLLPYESNILVFDNCGEVSKKAKLIKTEHINPTFDISIANYKDLSNFSYYTTTNKLFNINSLEHLPNFSGKIKYETEINIEKSDVNIIDFGKVGENIRLFVNGQDCGIRISNPYRFDISKQIINGKNKITAIVSNTLVYELKDRFSLFLQNVASGIQGEITLEQWKY